MVNKRGRPKKKKVNPQGDYQEGLVTRITECELVINELDNSPLWQVVIRDLEKERKELDDRWQDITDPQRWQEARVLKMAHLHILQLKEKYKEDLEQAQKELMVSQNTDTIIPKDVDNA